MLGPPVLIGDLVKCTTDNREVKGKVRWIGRLKKEFGQRMVVGVETVSYLHVLLHYHYKVILTGKANRRFLFLRRYDWKSTHF